MSEVDQTEGASKTVQISFGDMLQSKEAQKGIMKDIAASAPPQLGKAIPKEK